jgi:signal transduction histidine kinase
LISGSRELIGQAVANLIDNALKYGCPINVWRDGKCVVPEIEVAASRHGEAIRIAVADRGPGIGVADRMRVLDRFVRLENSRSRPGSGLGLSLAAAVARLHNGTLRVEDHEPGLKVVIELPAATQIAALPAPAPVLMAPGAVV